MILTSDKLIKTIKRRASMPTDNATFSNDDLLEMVNEEVLMFGVPQLLSMHEEHLVTYKDVQLEQNKKKYAIPYRAVGAKLREVLIVDSSGNIMGDLSRISLEDLPDYRSSNSQNTTVYYIENNNIVLVGDVPATLFLRMYYYLKPNAVVEMSKVATIGSIDLNTGVISLNNFPKEFSNLPDMDFIGAKSPNKTYSFDITPTSSNSNTKTVTFNPNDIPDELSVGDYVCVKEESPVPQLPEELHPVLAQRVAIACLEAQGDNENLALAMTKLSKMENSTNDIINNRVEGSNEKIVNKNSTLKATLSNTSRRIRTRF